ncbi:MAG: glycosyltransferase family 2 protein [Gemmatimonadota bacterium]
MNRAPVEGGPSGAARRAGVSERPSTGAGAIEDVSASDLQPLPRAVSVVIPALDEAGRVGREVASIAETLSDLGWTFEVIVVDDGSTDGTAEQAARAGARVLRHATNMGYGAALKRGIEAAKHEWILITDADGTYPTEAIPDLLARGAEAEMVVGARTGDRVHVPLARRPAKWFLRRLASYLAGRALPDLNSGMRLMRKRLIDRYRHLLPSGFSFTTTITLAAVCNGHVVVYVPIDYHKRTGESKIRPRHAFEFTMLILRTIVFFNPLKVFLPLGGVLALAGAAKFGYDLTRDNLSESAVLAFLGALIVWAVGLLADQNARIALQR